MELQTRYMSAVVVIGLGSMSWNRLSGDAAPLKTTVVSSSATVARPLTTIAELSAEDPKALWRRKAR
eukprot:3348437-Amphidinium_carterae.1